MRSMTTRFWRDTVLARASRLPAWITLLAGLLMIAVLSLADYYTGNEISFSIFYLVPVLYVTWYAGRWTGTISAVLAAVVWGVIDVASGSQYSSPIIPVWNALVRLGFFIIVLLLFSELQRSRNFQRELANTDSLTGIGNSRSFYNDLELEIRRLRRYGRPFTIAYADLDHFKYINDTFGHAAGDELLRRIAKKLIKMMRDSDTVARLGGDEFAILMPETDINKVPAVISRIEKDIEKTAQALAGETSGVGVTIGATVFLEAPESADAAVMAADAVMYAKKQSAKDTSGISVYAARADIGPG